MSQKFEKLQATLKKQAGELRFYDYEDFDIEVEGGDCQRNSRYLTCPNLIRLEIQGPT